MKVVNSKFEIPSVMELIRSLPTVRHDWRLKTPYKKFCYFYAYGRLFGNLMQMPMFKDDQTLCWWSYFAYFYYFFHPLLAMYTAYYYITISEYSKSLPCTCLLIGPLIAVSFQIHFQLKYKCRNETGLETIFCSVISRFVSCNHK